jgi:tetratricopeptide (TPR) repeat protein
MEKDKGRRYQTAEVLLDDLRNIEEGFPLGTKIKPRRETFVASLARKRFFIPAAVAVLAIIAAAIWQLLPKNGVAYPPTIENSIAIISFENQTKDQISDDFQKVIPNLLITSLEETGLFHVATWERMRDLLKQIGEDNVDIITADLGFQACRREGIMALGQGSYAKVGETIVIDVKILDVTTKQLLNTASSRGEGVESIINTQIDELSREIAQGMGIDRQTVEAATLNTSEVTTASIEAYKYFLKGREDLGKLYYEEARQSLEKAVIIDPEFAMAYLPLAEAYHMLGFGEARDEAYENAKTYSDKATEKQRLFIEVAYARRIERNQEKRLRILKQITNKYPKEKKGHYLLGDYYFKSRLYDKAIQEFKRAIELDPNYGMAINQLAYLYVEMEDYEKAIEYFERFASISPGDSNPLDSMAGCYFSMGRLDEAVAKYKEALEVKPDWIYPYWAISYINALEEDYSDAMKYVDKGIAMATTPGGKAEGLLLKGFFHFWLGSLDQSLKEIRTASVLAESEGNNKFKAAADWIEGYVYNEKGEHELAQNSWKSNDDYRKKHNTPITYKLTTAILLGSIDLKEGRIDSAKGQLVEIESLLAELTPPIRYLYIPVYDSLHAEALLAEGSLEEAVAVGKKLGWGFSISTFRTIAYYNLYFFKDLLARVYRQKGEWDKAIAEYERLMTFGPESKDRRLIHPLFHYRLAGLYEEKGWEGKAIEHYEKFLDLWKDADPGRAEVEDARNRLVGLKNQ